MSESSSSCNRNNPESLHVAVISFHLQFAQTKLEFILESTTEMRSFFKIKIVLKVCFSSVKERTEFRKDCCILMLRLFFWTKCY